MFIRRRWILLWLMLIPSAAAVTVLDMRHEIVRLQTLRGLAMLSMPKWMETTADEKGVVIAPILVMAAKGTATRSAAAGIHNVQVAIVEHAMMNDKGEDSAAEQEVGDEEDGHGNGSRK
jgi:hypothetical protein